MTIQWTLYTKLLQRHSLTCTMIELLRLGLSPFNSTDQSSQIVVTVILNGIILIMVSTSCASQNSGLLRTHFKNHFSKASNISIKHLNICINESVVSFQLDASTCKVWHLKWGWPLDRVFLNKPCHPSKIVALLQYVLYWIYPERSGPGRWQNP